MVYLSEVIDWEDVSDTKSLISEKHILVTSRCSISSWHNRKIWRSTVIYLIANRRKSSIRIKRGKDKISGLSMPREVEVLEFVASHLIRDFG